MKKIKQRRLNGRSVEEVQLNEACQEGRRQKWSCTHGKVKMKKGMTLKQTGTKVVKMQNKIIEVEEEEKRGKIGRRDRTNVKQGANKLREKVKAGVLKVKENQK